eukprot:TRINITY_DN2483_c0_g1_i4.p1 TRINITY_DN2483_c0_g1~~TRINITY_DN2483_c0_g1_i4.p1  ORF type:complete len:210 (+),score=43.98 TRINITY_DN2483_c0_g1_i4:573-1202(+)
MARLLDLSEEFWATLQLVNHIGFKTLGLEAAPTVPLKKATASVKARVMDSIVSAALRAIGKQFYAALLEIDECLEMIELAENPELGVFKTVALALKCVYNSVLQQNEFAMEYAKQCRDSVDLNAIQYGPPMVGFALLRVVEVNLMTQQMDDFYYMIKVVRSLANTWPCLVPLCQKALNGVDHCGYQIPIVTKGELDVYEEFEIEYQYLE